MWNQLMQTGAGLGGWAIFILVCFGIYDEIQMRLGRQ